MKRAAYLCCVNVLIYGVLAVAPSSAQPNPPASVPGAPGLAAAAGKTGLLGKFFLWGNALSMCGSACNIQGDLWYIGQLIREIDELSVGNSEKFNKFADEIHKNECPTKQKTAYQALARCFTISNQTFEPYREVFKIFADHSWWSPHTFGATLCAICPWTSSYSTLWTDLNNLKTYLLQAKDFLEQAQDCYEALETDFRTFFVPCDGQYTEDQLSPDDQFNQPPR